MSSTHKVRVSDAVLPTWEGVLPMWPGEEVDGVFVRSAPWPRDGEPALFVHGLGGSSQNWTDLMGLLRDHLVGEALDLPGFGRSQPARDFAFDTHVAAVVRRIERRGAGPVHLFGNSLGGAVCTRVAGTRPDLVRTLTLVSPALPSLRPRRGSDPRLPLLLVPGLGRLVARSLAKRTPAQRARAVLELCFADPSQISQQRVDEATAEVERRMGLRYADAAMGQSLKGLVAVYLDRGPQGLWRQAARIQAPTLVVWGAEDRLVHVSLAPKAAAAIPDARLLVLSATGHVAQMERPEVVARAVLGMIEEVRDRQANIAAS